MPLSITVRPPDRVNVLEEKFAGNGGALGFYQTILDSGANGAILSQYEKFCPYFGNDLQELALTQNVLSILDLYQSHGKYIDLAVAKLTKHDYGFRQAWPVVTPEHRYEYSLQWHRDVVQDNIIGELKDLPQNQLFVLSGFCQHSCELRIMDQSADHVISKVKLSPGKFSLHIVTCDQQNFAVHIRNTSGQSSNKITIWYLKSEALIAPWYTAGLGYTGCSRKEMEESKFTLPSPGFWQCEDPELSDPDALQAIIAHARRVEISPIADHEAIRKSRIFCDEPKNFGPRGYSPFHSAGDMFTYALCGLAHTLISAAVFDGDVFSPSHNGRIISRTNSSTNGGFSTAHKSLRHLLGYTQDDQIELVAWQEDNREYPTVDESPLFQDLCSLAELPIGDVRIGYYIGIQNQAQFIRDVRAARERYPNRPFNQIEFLSWDYSQFTLENLSQHIQALRAGLE